MLALPSIVETEQHMEEAGHHGPELLGLDAAGWVYVSISIFFLLAFFVFKAHRKITNGLDQRIADTRASLDEAKNIRAEAEALLADAKRQQAESAREAEAMLANAKVEAEHILADAEASTAALIERRKRMAEDKIAAAERTATDELRASASGAATAAARSLIAEKHGETEDRKLVDETIAAI